MSEIGERPKPKIRWSFRANSRVDIPILLAILGLLYGIAVFHWPGYYSTGKFHDLALENKRPLVDSLLTIRKAYLAKEIDRLLVQPGRTAKDSAAIGDTLHRYIFFQKQTAIESANLYNFNTDTSLLFFAKFFSADRTTLLDAIRNKKVQLDIRLRDTCCSPYPIDTVHAATLKISRESMTLVNFFDKYSEFGFWFVLSIAQMSMWFMLVVLVIGRVGQTRNIEKEFQYNFKSGFLLTLMPLIVVVIFAVVLYVLLIGEPVISDGYFLEGFSQRIYWYSFPGYGVAIICFGVYLFLANKLEILNGRSLNPNHQIADVQGDYQRLKSAFDFVFNCSAVILSIFVVWLGTLFSAVNNLEAARFYTLTSGKPLLNYDFVYLMGILHSLLLAIFYFPVRIQFNSLQLTKEDKSANQGTANTAKLFKTFGDIIGGILITASPFITTIVQKALSGLLG